MSQNTIDYATLPRRRMGAGVLFVDVEGRPLLVEPTYKPTWEIPGGVVEEGEDPRTGATREVREELGFESDLGRLLVIDHQTNPPPRGDSIMLVYEGGVLKRPESIVLQEVELRSFRFVTEAELDALPSERLAFRVRQAMRASREGTTIEIVNGQVAGSSGLPSKVGDQQQLVSAEAFWEMPDPPDRRIELVRGTVVDKPLLVVRAAIAKMNLMSALGAYMDRHDLGIVLPGVGCVLHRNPDTVRAVELGVFARESGPEDYPMDWFWDGPPTLAIEIASPDDRDNDIHERLRDYLDAGSRQVWVLWPQRRAVSVHRPDADTRELGADATLDSGDILPGFSVRVGDLFEVQ